MKTGWFMSVKIKCKNLDVSLTSAAFISTVHKWSVLTTTY